MSRAYARIAGKKVEIVLARQGRVDTLSEGAAGYLRRDLAGLPRGTYRLSISFASVGGYRLGSEPVLVDPAEEASRLRGLKRGPAAQTRSWGVKGFHEATMASRSAQEARAQENQLLADWLDEPRRNPTDDRLRRAERGWHEAVTAGRAGDWETVAQFLAAYDRAGGRPRHEVDAFIRSAYRAIRGPRSRPSANMIRVMRDAVHSALAPVVFFGGAHAFGTMRYEDERRSRRRGWEMPDVFAIRVPEGVHLSLPGTRYYVSKPPTLTLSMGDATYVALDYERADPVLATYWGL